MLEFLVIAAAIIIISVLVIHYCCREDIPPKAQLICDVWKLVEHDEKRLKTDTARTHVVHYSYPG